MKYLKLIMLVMTLQLLTASCTTGYQLAQQYVVEQDQIHVLVIPPEVVYMDFFPAHPDSVPPDTFFALEQGQFLHQVNDSLVIRNYLETLTYELNRLGITVYLPGSEEAFYELDSPAHIFSVAQMQLMEFVDQKQERTMVNGSLYEASVDITTLVQNTWFEYQGLHAPESQMQVLFSMQYRSDLIKGWFDYRNQQVSYEYVPYRLTIDDVYDLAATAAGQHAQYIFDYLMNRYIRNNLSSPPDDLPYFQYDRERHAIQPAYDNRFIIIPPEEQPDQE